MATEKTAMGSEPMFAQAVLDTDSTAKNHDESPSTDVTNRTITGSTTSSVNVCANGSDVVSSRLNVNGQACTTDFLKGSHRAKNSSYAYHDATLRGDRPKRNSCWSLTSLSPTKPHGNFSGAGRLLPNTQSHGFRPSFKGKQATGQLSNFANQKTSSVPYCGYTNGNANSNFWDHRDNYRKPERNQESDSFLELKCGPRTTSKNRPTSESSPLKQNNSFVFALRREMYNLPDFQTSYEDAKFFVIKSYSEDDVHKSIKYSVWSSTPYGNKKLDAAFRDSEAKTLMDGKKRPVFLFFSVNASRQFVGLAEMVAYVDFDKDLDFWQVDKWSGFFPVEWHVVKDVPNWELCHIVLDNNEGKPVTHTRDTHEIKLKDGLQMLSIFKNYSPVTSLLDDMNFYDEREKSLRVKKENKPATLRMDLFKEKDYDYEIEGNSRMNQERGYNWSRSSSSRSKTQASLVNLTKNLSIREGYSVSKKNTFNST